MLGDVRGPDGSGVDPIDAALFPESTTPSSVAGALREHARLYLETAGAVGHLFVPPGIDPSLPAQPSLLLVTRGRKSRRPYLTPLFYGRAGSDYVVIASKGGADVHPAWYRNLRVDSNARVQVAGERFDVTARTATGEERARLWREMADRMPFYDEYQTRTDRQIPVVVLSRR